MIEVPVEDTTIACLMQGKRPTKSDLVVPLEEDQWMNPLLIKHDKLRNPRTKWGANGKTIELNVE